jgi:hypothetical protein
MVYRIALSISLIVAPLALSAQTADDYFHGGAQSYIHAEKEKAKQEVLTGLQKFPSDPKLNGMAVLLKKQEEEQKQQQDQQKQQQEDQKQSSQSKPDQSEQKQDSAEQKEQQAKNDQDKKQQEEKQAQEKKAQEQKGQQEKEQQQAKENSGKPDDKSEGKDGEKTYAIGQMTPEQAQQLLDTQKNEEKLLPVKPTGKPADRTRPIRDW